VTLVDYQVIGVKHGRPEDKSGAGMATVRYGEFLVGELWPVLNDQHPLIRFSTIAEAVRVARRMADESARRGQEVQLHVMDIAGELRRVDHLPAVSQTAVTVKFPPSVQPQTNGTAQVRAYLGAPTHRPRSDLAGLIC
jgi:hypothetical protein